MNTRGLVELIVLNVGLEAKVISPKLFTIMVLMVRQKDGKRHVGLYEGEQRSSWSTGRTVWTRLS